jgi:YVTN family beta-propeller protein
VQINENIHHIGVFLTILGIMILLFIVILSNNAFAQGTLHNRTLYEVVNQSSGLDENPQIDVGVLPSAIRSEENLGKAFVANADSNTVSVLSIDNNTKIKDIPVGNYPIAIEISQVTNTTTDNKGKAFVANADSNTVSVLSMYNNTKIGEDIPVGNYPIAIEIDQKTGTVYVANADSNTVSVIDGKNDTKIGEDIPVGNYPIAIEIDQKTGTVYVANADSNGISVIDGTAHKAVAGIILEVNPFNSGFIVCDGLTSPSSTEQYIYVWSGAECVAKPNEGFEFVSWEQNLGNNSTHMINVSRSASTLDSFVLDIQDLFGDKPEEPEAKLNVAEFGTFTANFKELPPPVPQEFWLQSYVLVGTVIVGLSIPSIVVFITSKRGAKKLNYYHKQIASLYRDGRLDKGDLEPLDRLRSIVANAYAEGKLNEKHYESLEGEISTLYEEIFRKKIAALNSNNNYSVVKKSMQEQLAQIRNEVEYAFSMGKINEKHYDLLIKIIANLDSKER